MWKLPNGILTGKQVPVEFKKYEGYQNGSVSNLFDSTADPVYPANTLYLSAGGSAYIEFDITKDFNLYIMSSKPYPTYFASLELLKYNGTDYVLQNNTCLWQGNGANPGYNVWVKFFENIPKGLYRFKVKASDSYPYSISSQWFFEEVGTSKIPKNNFNEVKNVGDVIVSNYCSNTSNSVGKFYSNFKIDGTNKILPWAPQVVQNGYFCWIYVGKDSSGRKIFVADRTLQTETSYNTLNSAGFTTEKELLIDVVPNLTSYNSNPSGIIVTASTSWTNTQSDTRYSGWLAFNGKDDSEGDCWLAHNYDVPAWIKVYIPSGDVVNYIRLKPSNSYDGAPCDFSIQASDNDIDWITLKSYTNQDNPWDKNEIKQYDLENKTSYKYYRIYITKCIKTSYLGFGEIRLLKTFKEKVSIRLLTGGNSATDANSEWVKYIIGNDFDTEDGVSNDFEIWNAGAGTDVYDWCSESGTYRGYPTIDGYGSGGWSSNYSCMGFRPIMFVKSLESYLLKDENGYYNISPESYDEISGKFLKLPMTSIPTDEELSTYAFSPLSSISELITVGASTFKPVDKFGKVKICKFSDINDQGVTISGSKTKNIMVVSSGDILKKIASNIHYFDVKCNMSGQGYIKIVFSIDKGVSWLTTKDNGVMFDNINSTIPLKEYSTFTSEELLLWNSSKDTIKTLGVSYADLSSVNFNNLTGDTIRFAYVIGYENESDLAELDSLSFKFGSVGRMKLLKDSEADIDVYSDYVTVTSNINSELIKINILK